MEPEKKQRGGRRPGAGRKPMDNGRNIRMSFMLSPKAMQALELMASQQNTSKNDALNRLLESL